MAEKEILISSVQEIIALLSSLPDYVITHLSLGEEESDGTGKSL